MDTLDFFRRVLPDEGFYCAGLIDPEGEYRQRFYSTLEDLRDFVQIASGLGCDTYYAVSSFVKPKPRKVSNVLETKLFALDIDVGKEHNSYSNRRDAILALAAFVDAKHLPKPMIVGSGKGLHVYWVLTEALEYARWLPIAESLKQLAISSGLIIDPAVPADAARILRPTGTLHTSSGKQVALLIDAAPVDPEAFAESVGNLVPAHIANRKTTLIDNLSTSKPKVEYPKANPQAVVSKCAQVRWAVENQADVPEPFWYQLIGVAAHTTDPEEVAVSWSQEHPGFSEEETFAKLEQWKENASGPATCAKFESLRPEGCKNCVLRGKITSPAHLGAVHKEVEPPEEMKELAVVPLPRPFKRTAGGIKLVMEEDVDVDVCPFDIYPVGYGKDEGLGYEVVRYKWNRPHVGWTDLSFRQALLVEGHRDFGSTMADHGIVLGNKKQTDIFQFMLRSYMQKLRELKGTTDLYSTMGWKEHGSRFVLGDTIIRNEGGNVVEEVVTLSTGVSRMGHDMFGCAGSLQAWADGTQMLAAAHMPWHMFALNVGFAAPLFLFSGLKGMTVSLYGPTGGGKTLIQYWIQSIYGNPEKLHFAAKFTQNALFSRLGFQNHLPMTVDEATMFEDKDVGDFLYWVSQGRDKARLSRTADERDAKTWATPVIVSTNVSLQSKLIASGIDTDAQAARLLEVSVPAHKLFKKSSEAGRKIHSHLMSNYGHAGREYLKYLMSLGEAGIRQLITEHRVKFLAKYGASFSGEERFWEQLIVLSDLGAEIAHNLGLIKYDHTDGTIWVLDQLGTARTTAIENKYSAFDVLSEYLNEHSNTAITVLHTNGKPLVDYSREPRNSVHVRYDLHRRGAGDRFDRGVLLVDRAHFRRWLSGKGVDYKSFVAEMKLAGASVDVDKRMSLAKNTNIKLPPVFVTGFDLAHPNFSSVLNDAEDSVEKMAMIKLAAKDGQNLT